MYFRIPCNFVRSSANHLNGFSFSPYKALNKHITGRRICKVGSPGDRGNGSEMERAAPKDRPAFDRGALPSIRTDDHFRGAGSRHRRPTPLKAVG
jgi:hypothetical protein